MGCRETLKGALLLLGVPMAWWLRGRWEAPWMMQRVGHLGRWAELAAQADRHHGEALEEVELLPERHCTHGRRRNHDLWQPGYAVVLALDPKRDKALSCRKDREVMLCCFVGGRRVEAAAMPPD